MTLDQFRTAEDIRAELSDALDGYDMANASDDLYYLLNEVERLQAEIATWGRMWDDVALLEARAGTELRSWAAQRLNRSTKP